MSANPQAQDVLEAFGKVTRNLTIVSALSAVCRGDHDKARELLHHLPETALGGVVQAAHTLASMAQDVEAEKVEERRRRLAEEARTRSAIAYSLAERFHEAYERLAPAHGYETREASAKPWADVPDDNKRLMVAVVLELLDQGVIDMKAEG